MKHITLMFLLALSLGITSCSGATTNDEPPLPAEAEVQFSNGADTLAGTLFRPAGSSPSPAVVLLAGSDRSARGNIRIKLAKHFAANGVAALIYDSPGTGSSSGNAMLQSSEDRVTEALAAVDWLRGLRGIRPTSVGIFGGSEGANIALLAAAQDPEVAFVIPVSGSLGVSILDVLRYSAEKKGYQQGLDADAIAQAITFKEIAFALFSGVEIIEWSLLESRVKPWENGPWQAFLDLAKQDRQEFTQEQKQAFLDSLKKMIPEFASQAWFKTVDVGGTFQQILRLDVDTFFGLLASDRFSRDWDRGFSTADIQCPVLAIWGEEDSFLPPNQSAARLKKHLTDAGHSDFEVIVFPGASHFLTLPGSREDFVPGYLDTIVDWLDRRVPPPL